MVQVYRLELGIASNASRQIRRHFVQSRVIMSPSIRRAQHRALVLMHAVHAKWLQARYLAESALQEPHMISCGILLFKVLNLREHCVVVGMQCSCNTCQREHRCSALNRDSSSSPKVSFTSRGAKKRTGQSVRGGTYAGLRAGSGG